MKKILTFLFLLAGILFFSTHTAKAYDTCNPDSPTVPCSWNGETWDAYMTGDGNSTNSLQTLFIKSSEATITVGTDSFYINNWGSYYLVHYPTSQYAGLFYSLTGTHGSSWTSGYTSYNDVVVFNYQPNFVWAGAGAPTANCTSYNYSDWSTCQSDGTQTRSLISGNPSGCTVITTAVVLVQSCSPEPQLTISIDPIEGGNVTGDGISCNVDTSSVCQYPISQVSSSSLQANANCGYAFGYWSNNSNPNALSISGNTTITAKFFKTFRNAVTGGFKKANDTSGGECLEYVEYETEIPNDVCTYSAANCLGQANSKGYKTGNTPRVGAIVIYSQTSTLPYGHAAIVASIATNTMVLHESNVDGDGIVHERMVSINDINIAGYIYPTP